MMPSPLGSTKERGADRHGLWTAACRASRAARTRGRGRVSARKVSSRSPATNSRTTGLTSASSQRARSGSALMAARPPGRDRTSSAGAPAQRVQEHPPAVDSRRKDFLRRPPRSLVGSPTKDETYPFDLESLERFVDGTQRDDTARALLDFLPDRHAVGIVTQPEQRQQHELFEIAERRRSGTGLLDDV